MHILFTGDSEGERQLFHSTLTRYADNSYDVALAEGGEEMFYMLDSSATLPDLIFLAYELPLKDGLDCLKELRNNSKTRGIPVVMYCDMDPHWLVNASYIHGADFYLKKPDDIDDVLVIVDWLKVHLPAQGLKPGRDSFVLKATELPRAHQ
jgi:DNA-binding response OmpR family regulator